MIDWIGKTLGRVYIESLIARGGMAEVYLGTHTTLHRPVAVKILRNQYGDDPRILERFEMEARAVAKLRHPNIVQVFDFATIEDQPYLVMEYISGPSLSRYLSALHERNGRLELPLIRRLLNGVSSALQYAHESGVVHRDVKPGNILLTSRSIHIAPGETIPLDFEPVLSDFGLVRFLNSTRQTTVGQTAGTPAYMSPEQAMGIATDGRTDIYSLGIVLYELLSGNVPFDGETTMSVLLKHLNEAPAPIPGLSPALQEILDTALAKNADDRFQEPRELADAFNTALKQRSDASTVVHVPRVVPPTKVNRQPLPVRRRNWTPALLTIALIGLVGVSVLFARALPTWDAATPVAAPAIATDTAILSIPVTLGPTGVLHFQNGNATLDQATLIAQAMTAPPEGSQYVVWLVGEEERLQLGVLRVDDSGKGQLTFNDREDRNLLADYSRVEITIGSGTETDTNGIENLAYAYTLPEAGLAYLRRLVVSFAGAPDEVGLIHGLARNTQLIDEAAGELLNNYQSGNEAAARQNAETVINILVGDQSSDHKDWDRDGKTSDPGDGYGFLRNGANLGYIQAVYSHADYAVNSPGASRNMIVNGDYVKQCTQNLARWAPELHDQLLTILSTQDLSIVGPAVERAASLASQMLHGVDLNQSGTVEPGSDECGVLVAYEHTYRMADMTLLPVNPLDTPTPITATVTPGTPTSTPAFGVAATATRRPNQPASTARPATQAPNEPPPEEPQEPPAEEPRPTKERPDPTRRPDNPGNSNVP